MTPVGEGWLLKGLGASGPDQNLKEEMLTFGQFVGDWDILENRSLGEDGSWTSQTGELHWRWILDGKAVQDVWMYHDKGSGLLVPSGTTVRFFDPIKRLWRSIWITPRHRDVGLFLGKRVGDEIVLKLQDEPRNEGEGDVKWIFSEITQDAFNWRAEESFDGGKTWVLKQTMRIRRKPPTG